MRIVLLIQARMDSSRLPGKVMKPIETVPLIRYLIDRVKLADGPDKSVLAIPAKDKVLGDYAENLGFPVFRSERDESDVAGRFIDAAKHYEADAICRICADSPLIDPMLIDECCDIYQSLEPEICFNRQVAFPRGQSVEVLSTNLLETMYPCMDADEREHVTSFFRKGLENYACVVWAADVMRDPPSFLVDTPEDLERMTCLIGAMKMNHTEYGWQELVDLSNELKSISCKGVFDGLEA